MSNSLFKLGSVQTAYALNNRFEVFVPKFGQKSLDLSSSEYLFHRKKKKKYFILVNHKREIFFKV